MDIEPLEVYSRDSNYAVIKPPGRNYPGAVIQGDSLAILARMANEIARAVGEDRAMGEEFLANVEELNNLLVDRALHYQGVLEAHGIELPYVHAFSPDHLIELFPEDDAASTDNGDA